MRKAILSLKSVTVTAAALVCGAAVATEIKWTGNDGSATTYLDWNAAGNWAGGVVPGKDDTAVFENGGFAKYQADTTCGVVRVTGTLRLQRVNTGTFVTDGLVKADGTSKLISYGVRFMNLNGGEADYGLPIEVAGTGSTLVTRQGVNAVKLSGAITGEGMLEFHATTDDPSGDVQIQLSGDNSGFTGTCRVEKESRNRVRFMTDDSGFPNGTLEIRNTNAGVVTAEPNVNLSFARISTNKEYRDDKWYVRFGGKTAGEAGTLTVKAGDIGLTLGEKSHAFLTLVKDGDETDELAVWNTKHALGTEIRGGVLTVTHTNALMNGSIAFAGGTLKYGDDPKDASAVVTPDYSAIISNSTAAIKIDTNGKDVTWTGCLTNRNENLVGLTKTGAGTLTLAANVVTGTVRAAGGTLKLSFASTAVDAPTADVTFVKDDDATLDVTMKYTATGTTRQNVALENHGFPEGTTVNLVTAKAGQVQRIDKAVGDGFKGTLNFADSFTQTSAGGIVGKVDNIGSANIDFGVLGDPETAGTRIFDIETGENGRTVRMGALRFPSSNAKIFMKYRTVLSLGGLGKASYLNGAFGMKSCRLTINHTGPGTLKLGAGFRVIREDGAAWTAGDQPILYISGGTFETEADLTAGYDVTLTGNVALRGDATRLSASTMASASYTIALPASVDVKTGASTGYTLLTVPEGAAAPTLPSLDSLNTPDVLRRGRWDLSKVGNAYVLKFFKNGFVLLFR